MYAITVDNLDERFVYDCRQMIVVNQPGRLSQIDWSQCDPIQLTDTVTRQKPLESTEIRACWSADSLYIRFLCADSHIVSEFNHRDDPLYEQDVIEVFIDEDELGRSYFELEVSPRNVVFDALIMHDASNASMTANLQWRFFGLETEVDTTHAGLLIYYIRIPFHSFKRKPVPGTSWGVNFYRIDEGKNGVRQFQAWRPTLTVNYHIPSRFGKLLFI